MPIAARTRILESGSSAICGEIRDLFVAHDPPCVSIYVNTEAGFGAASRNFKRLKELLKIAETKLSTAPIGLADTPDLFNAAWRYIEQLKLNRRKGGGIALFIADNFFRHYILPEEEQERISIGRQFFVRPILRSLANDHFFLLALSQDHVKLFQGTSEGLEDLYVTGVPENLRKDFEKQSFERESEFHTASPAIAGKQSAIFHGSQPQQKDMILHFFRDVNEGTATRLKGQSAPLVLAAVHYLMPIYHRVNSYPHLLDKGIPGNPDIQPAESLHAAAGIILDEHFDHEGDSVFKMYKDNANTFLTSSNLREVVVAADKGRIRFLLLAEGAENWGVYDPPDTVHLHAQRELGDDELLNLAAVLTLRDGGHVFVPPKDILPEGASLAAIYRF
ncbi:MAG: hypothetical protein WAM91_14535 [Candidatus Acidiferrales bacterium]